jgi:ubiquinone/menaquinone biosynthesis C-methylase UbiE
LISDRLLSLVRCPDCHGRLDREVSNLRCRDCGAAFPWRGRDYVVLPPGDALGESTRFLDESFHADGRDDTVSPPLLSAGVRYRMLQTFLDLGPDDVALDLGCGSGRFAVWSRESGAHLIGIDAGTYFAAEARDKVDLVVGDLRKLPLASECITKAYSIDVLEHLSIEGLTATLAEAARVLVPGGSLFVYTHLRQRSPLAPLLRAVRGAAQTLERWGLADLTIEHLRKTDHLNPLLGREHLNQVAAAAGFRVARFRGYTPLMSSLAENILVPVAAHAAARRTVSRGARSQSAEKPTVDRAAMRAVRVEAKRRLAQRGFAYQLLRALTRIVMLDVALLGRLPSGPFFALLVKGGQGPA